MKVKSNWQIEHEQYQRLCRGDAQRPQKLLAKLKCYYNYGQHPYLRLMPHKEEVVNLKPMISIFHEVLSDSEIETVKELATPRVSKPYVTHSTITRVPPGTFILLVVNSNLLFFA